MSTLIFKSWLLAEFQICEVLEIYILEIRKFMGRHRDNALIRRQKEEVGITRD